jgi:Sulfotransferase family
MRRTQMAAGPRPTAGTPHAIAPDVSAETPAGTPPAAAGRPGQQWPVVVLAYAYSGAARVRRLLSASPVLACTSGIGLLPACAQAAAAWHQVDNRDGPLSSLAVSSIRTLAGSMISVILAGAGGSRWCEISSAPPGSAEALLQLYPGTKFLCLHRSCPDVVRACAAANPWGLAGTGLERFAAAYPGSSPAAIAAYWAERTEALLRFAGAHPAACRQVRYEDLAGSPAREAGEIFAFLGLDAAVLPLADENDGPAGDAGAPLPAGHLPPPLAQQVSELQVRLGYPPIT